MNQITRRNPYARSQSTAWYITLALVIFGLLLLVIGNQKGVQETLFLGANLGSIFANTGFALALLASFQWIFDTRFRSIFFRDIKSEIVASENITDAGLVDIISNSKNLDLTTSIAKATEVDIGIAYSDRFIKDYFDLLKDRKNLTVSFYYADKSDDGLIKSLAYMTRQSDADINRHIEKLEDFIDNLSATGTILKIHKVRSISHYSFFRFDKRDIFIVLSTFASRRATVPLLHVQDRGSLVDLVLEDIKEIESDA